MKASGGFCLIPSAVEFFYEIVVYHFLIYSCQRSGQEWTVESFFSGSGSDRI